MPLHATDVASSVQWKPVDRSHRQLHATLVTTQSYIINRNNAFKSKRRVNSQSSPVEVNFSRFNFANNFQSPQMVEPRTVVDPMQALSLQQSATYIYLSVCLSVCLPVRPSVMRNL